MEANLPAPCNQGEALRALQGAPAGLLTQGAWGSSPAHPVSCGWLCPVRPHALGSTACPHSLRVGMLPGMSNGDHAHMQAGGVHGHAEWGAHGKRLVLRDGPFPWEQ